MATVRDLPHTADVGFEVEAGTLERAFELAAVGLARALAPGAEPEGRPGGTGEPDAPRDRIELSRPDLDRLLVAWLRELLYRSMRDRVVPAARVDAVEEDPDGKWALRAEVAWGEPDPEAFEREIKGVTYHGLEMVERDGRWHARVVLDV